MPAGAFGPALIFGHGPLGLTPVEELEKQMKSRWAKHEIHLGMPLPEYLGPELIEVTIDMIFISPYTTEPALAIGLLELYVNLAVPQFLIMGTTPMGRGMSQFVIEDLVERMTIIEAGGRVTSAKVKVKLCEYPSSLSSNVLFNTAVSALGAVI